MALTPAEKQKRYRERQKELERQAALKISPAPDYLARPFSDFLTSMSVTSFELDENLDAFGIHIGDQMDNDFLISEPQTFPTQADYQEPLSSLQRATGLVGAFIDAARELSALINVYKLQEASIAIDEAMRASAHLARGDVEGLNVAFERIEKLKAIRSDLLTPTRITVPTIRSKHERDDTGDFDTW